MQALTRRAGVLYPSARLLRSIGWRAVLSCRAIIFDGRHAAPHLDAGIGILEFPLPFEERFCR